MNYRLLLLGCWLLYVAGLRAQTDLLHLFLPERTIAPGEIGEFSIYVANFDSIVSLQFSLNFDPAVAEYVGSGEGDLTFVAVGAGEADLGALRLSWFSTSGQGRTLPDSSRFVLLRFRAIGTPGQQTPLRITGDPLAIQIFRATALPGIFEPVDPEREDGLLRIGAPLGLTIDKTDVRCFGESNGSIAINLAADPAGYQFNWTGPDDFTAQSRELTGLDTGTYQLRIIDPEGMEVFTTGVPIFGPAAPLVLDSLSLRPAGCDGFGGRVAARAAGGRQPYSYALNGTVNATGDFADLGPGAYRLEVTDAGGCLLTDSLTIDPAPSPRPELGPAEQFLCAGDTLTLSIELAANSEAAWSTGATGGSIAVADPGTYSVTVTNAFGCAGADTVRVRTGDQLMVRLESDELEVCPGDSLQLAVSGATSYAWTAPAGTLDDLTSATPVFTGDSSTVLTVVAATTCATDTLTVPVFVYEVTATAGPDSCIGPGEALELMAAGGLFYAWSDNRYPVSDPTIPNPTVTPEDSTTYRVRITDVNGCVTEDEVTVLIANDPLAAVVPINLITPNGDGKNDVLEFANIEKYGFNSLKIYNRWGNLVYQRLNYMQDEDRFDGTKDGLPLPAGNYFYTLRFRAGTLKQTLVLLRE